MYVHSCYFNKDISNKKIWFRGDYMIYHSKLPWYMMVHSLHFLSAIDYYRIYIPNYLRYSEAYASNHRKKIFLWLWHIVFRIDSKSFQTLFSICRWSQHNVGERCVNYCLIVKWFPSTHPLLLKKGGTVHEEPGTNLK